MRAVFSGQLAAGVYAKDMILALIRQIGTAGATGYALEYSGDSIARLSMEERMTICNMSVEAGARAGLMAVDQTTIDYVRGRPYAPQGADFDSACVHWRQLISDPGSSFDQEVAVDVSKLEPQLSWGTSPEMVVGISEGCAATEPGARCQPAARLEPGFRLHGAEIRAAYAGYQAR